MAEKPVAHRRLFDVYDSHYHADPQERFKAMFLPNEMTIVS